MQLPDFLKHPQTWEELEADRVYDAVWGQGAAYRRRADEAALERELEARNAIFKRDMESRAPDQEPRRTPVFPWADDASS